MVNKVGTLVTARLVGHLNSFFIKILRVTMPVSRVYFVFPQAKKDLGAVVKFSCGFTAFSIE
jgi:hypothetical protein